MKVVKHRDGASRRPLFLLLAAVVLMAAVWSWSLFAAPKQQSLDEHVHSIAAQLRCPVCQGESVADAPSGLALEMRGVIRSQLQAGRSDQEIIQYFSSRYGEGNIVWVPQWQGFTLLAWLVPIVLLLVGLVLIVLVMRDWTIHAVPVRAGPRDAPGREAVLPLASSDEEREKHHETDLERYRTQLEQELVAEDSLFGQARTETHLWR